MVGSLHRGWFWRPGDDPGNRQFARVGDLATERGPVIPDVVIAYETWGELSAQGDNAVLVEHALTGDSHVSGAVGPGHPSAGWWDGLIGPGAPLDPAHYFVVASNVLGGCQGTTGPSTERPGGRPWGGDFPLITIRDQVEAEALLAAHLGVHRWHTVLGGSMGGMRALEWAVGRPDQVERAVVLASTPYSTADQIGWAAPQLAAIRSDPHFAGGHYYGTGRRPIAGMGVARQIAHLTYRSAPELDDRFGRAAARPAEGSAVGGLAEGGYSVESYLRHHADKLAGRFDPNSYVVLTEAMNHHDIGRGRDGWRAALRRFRGSLTVAAVSSDRLYGPELSQRVRQARPGTEYQVIDSDRGHDGFLVETDQVSRVISAALRADAPVVM